MNNNRRRKGAICLLLSSLILALAPRAFSQSVTITTFDVPGSGGTYVASINAEGAIVGGYYEAGMATRGGYIIEHGYIRDKDGTITPFDPTGSRGTLVSSINAEGAVAGAYVDVSGGPHGFGNPALSPISKPCVFRKRRRRRGARY